MILGNLVHLMVMAVITSVLSVCRSVTGIALQLHTLFIQAMVQWECVLSQGCRAPRIGSVAISALQPKNACVDVWLFVAIRTLRRGATINLVRVAVGALQCRMCSFQWKKCCVVEILQTVDPIVTHQALGTELSLVFRHENLIMLRVAINTGLRRIRIMVLGMAGCAGEVLFEIIQLM